MHDSNSKGQIFSADALLGVIVFLFAVSFIFYYFAQLSERNSSFAESFEIKSVTFNSLAVLVESKGNPENWESSGIEGAKSIGLASERNVLSGEKLAALGQFAESDKNLARKALGLGKYDFALSISDINGEKVFQAGSNPGKNDSFKTSRLCILGSRQVIVSMEAFK